MPSPSSLGFQSSDAQAGLYQTGVDRSNIYTFEPGVMVLPVAEDPPESPSELASWSPVDVVRVHAPYRLRRVSLNTHKQNNPPVMPTPADTGAFIFLSGGLGITTSLNQSFSNFDWTAAGEYVFVENCVSRPEDGLVLGIDPFQWIMSQTNAQYYGVPPQSSVAGAIAKAGLAPLVGCQMGNSINTAAGTQGGALGYGYNEPSYFPGTFFSADLLNGGGQVFQPPAGGQG